MSGKRLIAPLLISILVVLMVGSLLTNAGSVSAEPGAPTVETVSFSPPTQIQSESTPTITITAQLDAPATAPITVPFTVDGTATVSDDYTITPSPLTIDIGNSAADITISIVNDLLDEPDETVIVTMGTPINANQGSPIVSTATIQDNDNSPTVSFKIAAQSKSENGVSMTLSAELSGISGFPVTVPYTISGSATPTTDFSISPASQVTIPAGILSSNITISMVNDSLDEPDETVIFTMGTPINATKASPDVHTATIQDDDASPIVNFNTASQSQAEDIGSIIISAQIPIASSLDIIVPYTVTGTAVQPADYSILPSTQATIPAGSKSATISINVVDDLANENDETVIVTMGTPTNATKGITNISTATILDNDQLPTVSFTASAPSGAEDIGQIIVAAQLSTPSGLDVTVPFTLGGTATIATDYTILPVTQLIIPAGSPSANISITVIDDLIDEIDETVIITMGTPTNATQGTTIVSTATILDNDLLPTVSFVNNSTVENGGTLLIFAELNSVSGLDVTVPFSVSGGTATLTDDYSSSSTPIVISAGSLSASTSITVVNDFTYENDETIILTMGTPTNAARGLNTSATATIVDDEQLIGLGDFYEVRHSRTLNIPKTGFPGLLNNDPIVSNVSLTLEVSAGSGPAHGTLSFLNDDGSFRYIPVSGYVGPDSFEYIITNPANKDMSAPIPVTINVYDPTSPHVVWELPVENGMQYEVRCEDITLDVDASDDITVDHVVLSYFDYVTGKEREIEILTEQPYRTTFSTCVLNPEFNQINAIAYDNSGNNSGYPAFIWLYRYAYTVFLPTLQK